MREDELEEVLKGMLDYAYEKGILKENSVVYRDLFDTKIMGLLMPRPSEVIRHFHELYEQVSPEAATDYYYKLSRDSDYIRRYRICKDMKNFIQNDLEAVITNYPDVALRVRREVTGC